VLYNPESGDTHLLNLVERAALQIIADHSPIDFERLAQLLSEQLEVESDCDARGYLQKLIDQFDELGLIEPIPLPQSGRHVDESQP
jgi:PqqD family protein of HPr-rel-A system